MKLYLGDPDLPLPDVNALLKLLVSVLDLHVLGDIRSLIISELPLELSVKVFSL